MLSVRGQPARGETHARRDGFGTCRKYGWVTAYIVTAIPRTCKHFSQFGRVFLSLGFTPGTPNRGIYFRPSVATLRTNVRCVSMNSSTKGEIMSVLAAIKRFHGVLPACDWYNCKPSASVN